MEASKLIQIIKLGEDSKHQFKEKISDAGKLAAELVAFSNSRGGLLVFGVNDKRELIGLSSTQINTANQIISNAATNNVKPAINVITENIEIEEKKLILVFVEEGINKPYCDNEGAFWIKNGADKRKVTAPEELQRLFQSSRKIYADEILVEESSVHDLNNEKFERYIRDVYHKELSEFKIPIETLLENLHLAKNGVLNQAGLLLFGKRPMKYRPAFAIKAVSFFGNFIGGKDYRDSEDIEGDLEYQFRTGLGFLLRNLHKLQKGQNFNTLGILEVSQTALEELLQNAIIHRDYFKSAPIRLLIFDDRIEIINPGSLPNGLTVENIKHGNSAIRNPVIASFAAKILPYRGLGSGIIRALSEQPDIEFVNDMDGEQFVAIIPRPRTK
ncbi:MAG: putative DNA binding domain-containing protein [bacterium]|jgi:predicted HTH transcriptional regulator|nr:putative DNA binding domain-containing protein [bacterium]